MDWIGEKAKTKYEMLLFANFEFEASNLAFLSLKCKFERESDLCLGQRLIVPFDCWNWNERRK